MADRDALPDRSGASATCRSSGSSTRPTRATLAARIDPRRAARPPAATNPSGRRDDLSRGGRRRRQRGQPDRVELPRASARAWSIPATGIHYQNRGSYFSLDPAHPNVLEPGKRTLHTLLPGMLFRDGQPGPWVVAGSMGGDAQPQIHAQLVSALVDGGVDVRTGGHRAALVRGAGASISRRRSRSGSSRAIGPGSPRRSSRSATR